ncbi:MAG: DUF465 domain-containing protein [Candidatus Binatia bacterium]
MSLETKTDSMNRDSMLGQNHDLYHEFPEFADQIQSLWSADQDFAHLAEDYTKLNREVIRIEQGVLPRNNEYFEDVKKKRLLHKDKIYALLSSK